MDAGLQSRHSAGKRGSKKPQKGVIRRESEVILAVPLPPSGMREWLDEREEGLKIGTWPDPHPNTAFRNGDTFLHALLKHEEPDEKSDWYLKSYLRLDGVDPNARDETGQTALMIACGSANARAAYTLANNGETNLDAVDEKGNSALVHAVNSRDLHTLETLLMALQKRRRFRTLFLRNNQDQTAEAVAESHKRLDLAILIATERRRANQYLNSKGKAPTLPPPSKNQNSIRRLPAKSRSVQGAKAERNGPTLPPLQKESEEAFAHSVRTVQNVHQARKRFLSLIGVFHQSGK